MMGEPGEEMEEGKKQIEETEDTEDTKDDNEAQKTFLPKDIQPGEQLTPDMSAYEMLHTFRTRASCLSFDVLRDRLGTRTGYPVTAYMVAGTQAQQGNKNSIIVMKASNLNPPKAEDAEEEKSEDEDEDEDEPLDKEILKTAEIYHAGAVNRVRICPHVTDTRTFVASWSEKGKVHIWDIAPQLSALETEVDSKDVQKIKPLYTFGGHVEEGYAMDWSPTRQGYLLTGDCTRHIHMWTPRESDWIVSQQTYSAHGSSVEDIQWSPNEEHVFSSCSTDKSIRVWDDRAAAHKACMITVPNAHESDVNVINWNKSEPFLVSGGDDGVIKIWDLRKLDSHAALFKHHTGPITSVEWHPSDSSVFGASGEDNQVSLWDLGVESSEALVINDTEVPPQLLFIHQGQEEIKELHWHPHIEGVLITTSLDNFNIFKTISV
ncbi:glutamate-rich WD repeat-containing protein 1-like isoform X1 [Bolinopsis microptera]|uniref:glutamate-rich WD repeat-containing protein 1-like isoform X1 n=2 Tax=Bolinopsis microptera TaxID=2820187 RepID=UPI003079AA2F